MLRGSFLLVFAASGAAALVYEVTWTRLLALQLGQGVAAASTVLAAFMGGLAVGAALGGRLGNRLSPKQALTSYVGCEAAIAGLALLVPFELAALHPLLVITYANGDGAIFGLFRVVSSLVVLSAPAAVMGATFPLASRWMVRGTSSAATDAGWLYTANTVGAASGAVLAGFLLLPSLGLSGTTWVGVALNVSAAAGALAIGRRGAATWTGAARSAAPRRPGVGPRRRGVSPRATRVTTARPRLAALALAVSGFSSLTLQVVWTRLLALVLGPTTYAFSVIVTCFIAGIALGAAIGSRLAARTRDPLSGLAVCLVVSVALAMAAAGTLNRGLLLIADVVARPDAAFGNVLVWQVLIVAAILVPMTVAFGIAFPFAVAAATSRDESLVTDLGMIYAVNTSGAIAGSLLAGFMLIPWLGLHGTVRLVALVSVGGAVAVTLAGGVKRRGRTVTAMAAVAVLVWAWWMPSGDPLLLSSGAYKYAPLFRGPNLESTLTAGQLRYYREGAAATVTVRDLAGTRSLAIDGKVDASDAGDMLTQRVLAHLPLLLHPTPRNVAIIGLGSGVTLGSALRHPIDRATMLELSPGVVEASRFFERQNHGALSDPRTRLILGDGRTHLLLGTTRYDVIVSEPSNPWMAGIASLFTREFFEAARARLAPGGVLCQWAHTYDISTADLKSIVATFLSVFPDGTLWLVGEGDVLLVGSRGPLTAHLSRISNAWHRPGVAEDLAGVGALHPFSLLSLFIAEGSALRAWTAGAPVQTDDRAALEFSGPRTIYAGGAPDNAARLRALARATDRPDVVERALATASAADWRDRGWMLIHAEAYASATEDFMRALDVDPDDARALEGVVRAAGEGRLRAGVEARLRELATEPKRVPAKLALSRLLAGRGEYDEAMRLPLSVLQADPRNVEAQEQLASVLADLGDVNRLAPVVAQLQAEAPQSEAARYYAGTLLFMQGRLDLAVQEAQAVVAQNASHAKAQNLLGASLAQLGRHDEAQAAFQASLAANPRDPATYANLGTLELEAGDRPGAARYFAEALTVDPASEIARQGLAEAMPAR
ncbi:MAG: tetratricopeptide repeat protein [Luteitalea sp.]|nr:tetratricopeptide repeat protein [Luteitalea sp.]